MRHNSRTNPSTCRKIKYSSRSDTPGSWPTNDYRWSATQARLLAPHRLSAARHPAGVPAPADALPSRLAFAGRQPLHRVHLRATVPGVRDTRLIPAAILRDVYAVARVGGHASGGRIERPRAISLLCVAEVLGHPHCSRSRGWTGEPVRTRRLKHWSAR